MRFKRGNRRNKSNPIKKAMWSAKKPEDKLQNKAIFSLQKQVKALKKAPEIKFFDNSIGVQYVDASSVGPYTYPWSQIGQGIDYTERIGDSITPLYSHFKMILTCGQYEVTTGSSAYLVYSPSIFRIITFIYLEDQSISAPNLSQLLNTPTVDSNRNPLYLKNFKIVHDRCYTMDSNNPTRIINLRKRLTRKMRYNDPAYSGTTTNALYVYILSNDLATAVAGDGILPWIQYDHRLTFTDD